MNRFALLLPVLVAALLVATPIDAAIVLEENFTHPDGPLVGQVPTPGPGGAWAAHSDPGVGPVVNLGGEALLSHGNIALEDVSSVFTAFGAADTMYAGFDFRFPVPQVAEPDATGLVFAHFLVDGGGPASFRGQVGILAPTGGGDFTLAINADGADLGAGVSWGTDLFDGVTYRAVISWNAATGESRLWVDPVDMSSPNVSHLGGSTGSLIDAFALVQGTSAGYNGRQAIDNLIIADSFDEALGVPEPGSLSLLLLGVLGLAARRRR